MNECFSQQTEETPRCSRVPPGLSAHDLEGSLQLLLHQVVSAEALGNMASGGGTESLELSAGDPLVNLVVVVAGADLGRQENRLRSSAALGAGPGGGALHGRTVAQLAGARSEGKIHLLAHPVSWGLSWGLSCSGFRCLLMCWV